MKTLAGPKLSIAGPEEEHVCGARAQPGFWGSAWPVLGHPASENRTHCLAGALTFQYWGKEPSQPTNN